MLHGLLLGDKFFDRVAFLDEAIGAAVCAAGCGHCGGRLHRGDYPRKPRGGLIAAEAAAAWSRRISYCCAEDGCRRRATPPSLRFMGRRVYLGAAMIIAGMWARVLATPREVRRKTGVPPRTVARWQAWWQHGFVESRVYREGAGRFMPPLELAALPTGLVERFTAAGRSASDAMVKTAAFVAPLTTGSVHDGARFVRDE